MLRSRRRGELRISTIVASFFLIVPIATGYAQSRLDRGRLELEVQYRVPEGLPTGIRVAQLSVDSRLSLQSLYSPVEYASLTYALSRESHYFQLDSVTSVLTVSAPIDRESVIRMFLENHAEAKTAHGISCVAPNGSQSVYSQLECRFSLLAGVSSGSSSFKWVTINIVIGDVNDNAPSWSSVRSLNISIPEQVPIGYCARITPAIDHDFLQNGTVFYTVSQQRGVVPFELRQGANSDDLCVRVVSALDREVRDQYQLTLVARDGGVPPQSTSVVLNVRIADDNDNAPMFNRSYETIHVSEAAQLRTVVYNAAAFDLDVSDRSRLRYFTSAGQDSYCNQAFAIDPETGSLTVANVLDRETRTACHLQVSVTDGKFTGEQSLTVFFDDVNDNAPRIEIILLPDASRASSSQSLESSSSSLSSAASTPTFEIVEHSPSNKMVLHVEVTDADDAHQNNNMIVCFLDNNEDYFRLDQHKNDTRSSTTYTLSTNREFDREERSVFMVSIACKDFGEPFLISRKNVTVIVSDINDHAPVFSQFEYVEKLKENNIDDFLVFYAHATDSDVGENARVEYALNRSTLPREVQFEIDRDSGELRVMSKIDRERHGSNLTFQIIARDCGTPRRSASVSVTLSIDDVNDHAPKFTQSQYRFEVREDASLYAEVGRVHAIDADAEAPNSDVIYSLQRQVPHSSTKTQITMDTAAFSINSAGAILLVGQLDYERVQSYTLYVVARDHVALQLAQSAYASVHIDVKDVNDNRPRWQFPSEKSKAVNVSCFEPIGKVVAQLIAQDDDSDENANLLYAISHLSQPSPTSSLGKDDYFAVNDITGQVSVSKPLPCPLTSSWNDIILIKMVVNVTDRGLVSLSSVSVLDLFIRNSPPMDSRSGSAKSERILEINLSDQSVVIALCAVMATLLTAVVLVIVAACYKLRKPQEGVEDVADAEFNCRRNLNGAKMVCPTAGNQAAVVHGYETSGRSMWNSGYSRPLDEPNSDSSQDTPCSLWKPVDFLHSPNGHISEETEGTSEADPDQDPDRDTAGSPSPSHSPVPDDQGTGAGAKHSDPSDFETGNSPREFASFRHDVSKSYRANAVENEMQQSARSSCARSQTGSVGVDPGANRRAIRPVSSTLNRKHAPHNQNQNSNSNMHPRTASHALFKNSPSQKFSPFSLRTAQSSKLHLKSSSGSASSSRSYSDLATVQTLSRSLVVESDAKACHARVYEAQSFKPTQQTPNPNQTSTFV